MALGGLSSRSWDRIWKTYGMNSIRKERYFKGIIFWERERGEKKRKGKEKIRRYLKSRSEEFVGMGGKALLRKRSRRQDWQQKRTFIKKEKRKKIEKILPKPK